MFDEKVNAYDHPLGWKYITVGRLKELLRDIPDDAKIGCNRVHNFLVMDDRENGKFDFWIDLATEGSLDYFNEEELISDGTLPPNP
jgi:hypothetical protein